MMRKIVSILLVVTMMIALFGCDDKGSNGNDPRLEAEVKRNEELYKKIDSLSTFDVITNIHADSFVENEDGSVMFTVNGPDNKEMHFYAENVEFVNGELKLYNQSKVYGLNSIGRIYAYTALATDYSHEENNLDFGGAFTFSDKTEVSSIAELALSTIQGVQARDANGENILSIFNMLPNFVYFGVSANDEAGYTTLSSFVVHYSTESYTTNISHMKLNDEVYGAYLKGEKYNPNKETYRLQENILDFYLCAIPDIYPEEYEIDVEKYLNSNYYSVYGIEDTAFTIGDIKDTSGNVVSKDAPLDLGYTIDIQFGDKVYPVSIPVLERYKDAKTIHELVPSAYPNAVGDLNVLVVPISWQDMPANDEDLNKMKEMVGKVNENGSVTDYTIDMSLSQYFDKASYGKLNITSYVTDWYEAPYTFEEMKYSEMSSDFSNELLDWLYSQDLDMGTFDLDHNQLFDAVVLLNNGDMHAEDWFYIISFGGAYHRLEAYTGENKGTDDKLGLNAYINMNVGNDVNTLIHEFGHTLGLVDYYDVTYSGINAVGGYDMQSDNGGDWNPYSKYAVNWVEPTIVRDLAVGESMDIEIEAFAKTGDAIVIPAAGSEYDGPFNEYIMVDLFTDTGLATYHTDYDVYDIKGVTGVRMYHVNANMERRDLMVGDEVYPIGTIHYGNDYKRDGKYLIEWIQAQGKNTFTDMNQLDPVLDRKDFFYQGDVFTAEKYSEFLTDGKMDNGFDFGYEIKVVSLDKSNQKAVIRVTRK